jgi:DNA modification methylase
LSSPKVGLGKASRGWYPYYAGYSTAFVRDALSALSLQPGSVVLDPWNGSGTTTYVAAEAGLSSVGYDANPALVVVAKARLLGLEVAPSVEPLADEIVARASAEAWAGDCRGDPLAQWFIPDAVRSIRSLGLAIQHLLVQSGNANDGPATNAKPWEGMSSLAAFFYVCLFTAVRSRVTQFESTNPTWIKIPAIRRRVRPSLSVVEEAFRDAVETLSERLESSDAGSSGGAGHPLPSLGVGCSEHLDMDDESVDAVLASPPYCTRIDYVRATLPELAVLGVGTTEVRALREAMLGTPTIQQEKEADETAWGPTASAFLRGVKEHSSRASSTYYFRTFAQYFDGLHSSMKEIARVLREGGTTTLVVQDSYYKELRVDLAEVVTEMGCSEGLRPESRTNFEVRRTKAAVNPGARSYRDVFSATESAITLVRA